MSSAYSPHFSSGGYGCLLSKLCLIQYFVIANEVKQSSTVVLQELLDCRVLLPRFARSFGTLLDDTIKQSF
jgi:hypothetical protein